MGEKVEKNQLVYRDRKTMLLNNFLGGLTWGCGTVIGGIIIIGFVAYVCTKLEYVPFLGDLAKIIRDQIYNYRR